MDTSMVPGDMVHRAIRRLTLERKIMPVLCGAARREKVSLCE